MDKTNTQFRFQCSQHPDQNVEFMQINNLQDNKKDQKLLYCLGCIDQDSTFQFQNYLWIKNIINSREKEMLSKWPPVNDEKLLIKLIEASKLNSEEKTQQMVVEIEKYFMELKRDIMFQIDICQKKIIHQAQSLSKNESQILNIYQPLSKINELKSILVDNSTDIHEKERLYRVFIENVLQQKQTITQQLSSLLDEQLKQQTIFNSESPLKIKEQILKSIRDITFLEFPNNQSENKQKNQHQLDVQLMSTNYEDGQKYLDISKNQNNQYQIIIKDKQINILNTVSVQILQKDVKYIFRFYIEMKTEQDRCYFGLMADKYIHSYSGLDEKMSCRLNYVDKCIRYTPQDYGIDKIVKGNQFKLSQENEIEMRVCLQDQILEVLDYPNYHFKLAIQDKFKSQLNNQDQYRLYLGMCFLNNKIILKEALRVEQFE